MELNGHWYNTGEALLLGCDSDEYLFSIIECIIVHKSKVHSLVEKMETVLIIFTSMHMTCWDNNIPSFTLRRIN